MNKLKGCPNHYFELFDELRTFAPPLGLITNLAVHRGRSFGRHEHRKHVATVNIVVITATGRYEARRGCRRHQQASCFCHRRYSSFAPNLTLSRSKQEFYVLFHFFLSIFCTLIFSFFLSLFFFYVSLFFYYSCRFIHMLILISSRVVVGS